MKRTERRHLKENEVEIFTRQAREFVEVRRREMTAIVIVVAVGGAAALGYYTWQQRVQSRAHAMLANAIAVQDAPVAPAPAPGAAPPVQPAGSYPTERARAEAALARFKSAADAYPSSDAGIYARYQQAVTLMTLNRPAEASSAFDEVVKRSGDSIYGQMARLGLAEARARQGQYDPAINALKELAQRKEGPLPIDGILMQLGRIYLDAGKPSDAQQMFNRLVQEFPESVYTTEARKQLDSLKKA